MGSLSGKSVVITGAGSGIGAAYAHLATLEGAKVVVNDIDTQTAQDTTAMILQAGGTALACPGDTAPPSAASTRYAI